MHLLLILLLGCSVKTESPPPPTPDLAEPGLPDPDDPRSYEPTYGERTTIDALYRISPIEGGKALQAVSLVGEGFNYVRSYRPQPDEYRFADKRVRVTGRTYRNSPYVQSVDGEHFEVESIELAPGEAPWDPAPTTIPTPAQAKSAADAKAQAGWFAACHGTLKDGTFTFLDGSTLPVGEITRYYPVEGVGERMTLLAWVGRDGTLEPRGGCAGDVPRCGVHEP